MNEYLVPRTADNSYANFNAAVAALLKESAAHHKRIDVYEKIRYISLFALSHSARSIT